VKVKVAKPNLIDRMIGVFSPALAVDRIRARTSLEYWSGGYKGGKRDRRATKNWQPQGNSADADILPDLPTLRARARDLARNTPVATGAIATYKTHVVGDGLVLNAQCDRVVLGITEEAASAWNKLAEREFEIASATIDWTGVQSFDEMQALAFGGVLESGDIFALRKWRRDPGQVYGAKVQMLEADRVSNPHRGADTDTVAGGIEHSASGVRLAYHVANVHPGDIRRMPSAWRRVPAFYNDGRPVVLHLFERLRPDQTRGVPLLAPVVELFKSFGDYTDAEVRAAVISAMFTVFVKNSADTDTSPLPTSDAGNDGDRGEIELGAGAIVDLAPGEDITVANPGRPNPVFDAFATAVLRQIGVALELPFELLIKHFTSSYSASRAALEMAYHTFRRRRTWLARKFCQPVYEWVIEEAILTGRLEAPGFYDDPLIRRAWLNAEWTGPVRASLDPKKEAEADAIDVQNGFKTYQQVLTERTGGDFDQKTEQLGRETAARTKAGIMSVQPAPTSAEPTGSEEE